MRYNCLMCTGNHNILPCSVHYSPWIFNIMIFFYLQRPITDDLLHQLANHSALRRSVPEIIIFQCIRWCESPWNDRTHSKTSTEVYQKLTKLLPGLFSSRLSIAFNVLIIWGRRAYLHLDSVDIFWSHRWIIGPATLLSFCRWFMDGIGVSFTVTVTLSQNLQGLPEKCTTSYFSINHNT